MIIKINESKGKIKGWRRINSSVMESDKYVRISGLWTNSIYLKDEYFKDSPFGIPCVVCHGMTGTGRVGPPNSFRFPAGPAQLQYYKALSDTTFVVGELAGGELVGPAATGLIITLIPKSALARMSGLLGRTTKETIKNIDNAVGNVQTANKCALKTTTPFDEYMHFRNQGFTPAQSKYLTQPYGNRAGHHFPIPQRVGRGLLPDSIVDSQFNVLRPRDISLGRFYELHYAVDPYFNYANFPRAISGGWNGNTLGLQRYNGLKRIWYSTPGPTKIAGGGVIAGGYWWFLYDDDGE